MKNKSVNFYIPYVPTFMERLRRFFGYGFNQGDKPSSLDPKKHISSMRTNAGFKFSWKDRLRLLLTGRLLIVITQHTTQEVDESVNSIGFQIYAPFED